MSIDWDALLLAPIMDVFGEGDPLDETSWPLYTPRGAAPAFRLRGAVFDNEYQRTVSLGEEGGVQSTTHIVLGVRAALFLVPPAQSDLVYIPSVDRQFIVTNPEPDGKGHILLFLGDVG